MARIPATAALLGLASSDFVGGMRRDFVGVTFRGAVRFPTNYEIEKDNVLGGISSLKFARKTNGKQCNPMKEACTVLALGDSGVLHRFTLDVRDQQLDNGDIVWQKGASTQLQSQDRDGKVREWHDTEGLAVGRSGDPSILASLEADFELGLESDIQRFNPANGDWWGNPFKIPDYITKYELNNAGFEALGETPDGRKVFTTTEEHITVDDACVHRLLQFSHKGGKPERQLKYHAEPVKTDCAVDGGFGVVELDALNENNMFSLERNYNSEDGSRIRLYHVSAGGNHVASVDDCEALTGIEGECGGLQSAKSKEVSKTLLMSWDGSGMKSADGHESVSPDVAPVDNYEGMTLLPASSSGDRQFLLLANDDNFSEYQIGTQIVLLELRTGSSSAGLSEPVMV